MVLCIRSYLPEKEIESLRKNTSVGPENVSEIMKLPFEKRHNLFEPLGSHIFCLRRENATVVRYMVRKFYHVAISWSITRGHGTFQVRQDDPPP